MVFDLINVEVLIKLLVAFVLGSALGYEREKTKHPAGFRTHILVCVTSAFLVTSSLELFSIDTVGRIVAGIITGIGFLGAGSIIVLGDKVRGLTTAASVWATAGLGVAVGLGAYFEAIIATLLFLFTLRFKPIVKKG
jgi:putative Mg2+ transporter-C (MgtC) family protein